MGNGPSRLMASFNIDPAVIERHNWKLFRKYQEIEKNETMYETYMTDDADIVAIAYGCVARIAKGAIKRVRKDGVKVGLIRPITLWPFPSQIIKDIASRVNKYIVFEMSTGQMIDDVRLAVEGKIKVQFHGRPGGAIPTPVEFARIIYREYQLESNS
jgi:2-oxoglutarate ferredoxin oxidoreductase subunit alpha